MALSHIFFSIWPFSSSMFNLYNLLENPYSRFFVYMKALNLAVNGKVIEHIVPSFKKMDSFLKEWNLGVQDQRELFLTISNILKESKRYNSTGCLCQKFFLLYSMFSSCLYLYLFDYSNIFFAVFIGISAQLRILSNF